MLKFTVGVNEPAYNWCVNNGFVPQFQGVVTEGDVLFEEEGTGIAAFDLPRDILEQLLQNSL